MEEVLLNVLANSPYLASIYIVGRFILQPSFSWMSSEFQKHREHTVSQIDKRIEVELARETLIRQSITALQADMDEVTTRLGEAATMDTQHTDNINSLEASVNGLLQARDHLLLKSIEHVNAELRDIRMALSIPSPSTEVVLTAK